MTASARPAGRGDTEQAQSLPDDLRPAGERTDGSSPPRRFRRGGSGRMIAVLFVLPVLVLLLAFRVWPLFSAFKLSFTYWDGFSDPVFVGLRNFRDLLTDTTFRQALFNNIKLLIVLPVWVLFPLFIAQAIHNRIPGWRIFRLAFFLPAVVSPVVLGVYYGLMLRVDGPVNNALSAIGLSSWATDWLNQPTLAFAIVTLILMWSTFGVGVLIYLAGLSNLDPDIVEAATVDGASSLQVQRHIVFWLMIPVVRFWTVIILIISFTGVFPLVFSLTRGGPGFSTYVVEFDLYQEAFSNGNPGYASAIGIVLLVLVGGAVGLASWMLRSRVD